MALRAYGAFSAPKKAISALRQSLSDGSTAARDEDDELEQQFAEEESDAHESDYDTAPSVGSSRSPSPATAPHSAAAPLFHAVVAAAAAVAASAGERSHLEDAAGDSTASHEHLAAPSARTSPSTLAARSTGASASTSAAASSLMAPMASTSAAASTSYSAEASASAASSPAGEQMEGQQPEAGRARASSTRVPLGTAEGVQLPDFPTKLHQSVNLLLIFIRVLRVADRCVFR